MIKDCRIQERDRMKEYIQHKGCLMQFVTQELDDPNLACGYVPTAKMVFYLISQSRNNSKALNIYSRIMLLLMPEKDGPGELN